jgi:hypothetical protein
MPRPGLLTTADGSFPALDIEKIDAKGRESL